MKKVVQLIFDKAKFIQRRYTNHDIKNMAWHSADSHEG